MNKRIFFYLLVFYSAFCFSQEKSIENDLFENETLSYNVQLKKKSFFRADTSKINYTVTLKKNSNDSLYGYDFKITNKQLQYINSNNTLYSFSKTNEVLTVSKEFNLQLNNLIIPNIYLKNENLSDSLRIVQKNKESLIIRRDKKDFKEFDNIYVQYYINLKNPQTYKITTHVNFRGRQQYKEKLYQSISPNGGINFSQEIKRLRKHFSEPNSKKEEKLAAAEHPTAENFEGYLLSQEETVDLSSYYGKLIILDFWYMSCYPCIKSIPFINKLHNDFTKEEVMVFGVNLIDENKRQIKKFVKDFDIQYEVLLAEKNPYKIKAYPTIVIINKNKEIVYSGSGMSKDEKLKIIRIINETLKD